ncbi:class I SAM-dependent DNA methyltransferase [Paenibacillus physcomitrellae]|uniref:Methyltransferase n=1 Tax=Paenibacillus physcomitrellae TaxID=1619311 RepID=A0ABQ1FKJ4_9BACL|nr:class I SAM-dependent methyltransferase [Paenibacillus physcomitrellae]GGA20162.1 methyltransferase [Paenibacillus physcomitrellae]
MEAYRKFAYVYDELMQDMPYESWVEFAQTAWQKHGIPHTVAELGCGTGSITIPLTNAGYQMTGIDLSEDMLSVAQNKMEASAGGSRLYREGSVRWVCQDMRSWELPEPVDSVISFCDCMNYVLEPEEIAQVFVRTYDALKEGGSFLFDVHHPDTLRRYGEEQPFVLDEPEVSYIWTCDFDEERWEIEHHLSIFARVTPNKGSINKANSAEQDSLERSASAARQALYERFEEIHIQRAYDPEWMMAELRRAGFKEIKCYADFEWKLADDEAERLFFVAIK